VKRWTSAIAGFAVGAVVATGGFALAQGYLGQSTLTVNGTAYSGTFTPQESANDLLVPVSQLSAAMGFKYAWANNTLAITTNGTTPATGTTTAGTPASNGYPETLALSTPGGSSAQVAPVDDLNGTWASVSGNGDPYVAVKVTLEYDGKPHPANYQTVQLALSPTPSLSVVGWWNSVEVFDANCIQGVIRCVNNDVAIVPMGNAVESQDYTDFGKAAGASDSFLIYSADAGTYTITVTDTSNKRIAPVSTTITFKD